MAARPEPPGLSNTGSKPKFSIPTNEIPASAGLRSPTSKPINVPISPKSSAHYGSNGLNNSIYPQSAPTKNPVSNFYIPTHDAIPSDSDSEGFSPLPSPPITSPLSASLSSPFGRPLPQPPSVVSPTKAKTSPRPSSHSVVRNASESVVQKQGLISAALAKAPPTRAHLSSVGSSSSDCSKSSLSSKESEDLVDTPKKKDEKKLDKQKLKEEKQKQKEIDKESKKPKSYLAAAPMIAGQQSIVSSGSAPEISISTTKITKQKSSDGSDLIPTAHEENSAQSSNNDKKPNSISFKSNPLHHALATPINSNSPQSSPSVSPSASANSVHEPKKTALPPKPKKIKQYVQDNTENYANMSDLLMRNSFLLMRALEPNVKRADLERVSKDFIGFLSWKEITLDYIKAMIRQDVDNAESEGTLFRTNSLVTAIMSGYCQKIGKSYLKSVLSPCLQWLQESPLSFEIDPAQVDNPEIIKQNIFNLNYLTNKFFKGILNSLDGIPFEIREIANSLQIAVLKRFPNSKYTAVGGFFFLRLVCPAVLSPETFDVPEEAATSLRRPLVLVAKTLQQIANDQKFNEPHMEPLNQLISKWTVKVHQFFDELVQKDKNALLKERDRVLGQIKDKEERDRILHEEIDPNCVLSVHRILLEHVDEMIKKYADKEKELGYNPVQELKDLFDAMGPPPEKEEKKSKVRSTSFFSRS